MCGLFRVFCLVFFFSALSLPALANDVMELAERLENKALNGDVRAAYKLGLLFSDGKKISPDHYTANQWYERAAASGYRKAMNKLGAYHAQQGNIDQALSWYTQAAERGSVNAMVLLGDLYHNRENHKQALGWYKKAAFKNNAIAMREVGASYLNSTGVRFDLRRAYAWFLLAHQAGDSKARVFLRRIGQEKGTDWSEQIKKDVTDRLLPPDYWHVN